MRDPRSRGAVRLALASLAALSAGVGGAGAAALRVEVGGIEPGGGRVYVTLCQEDLSEAACGGGQEAAAAGTVQGFAFADLAPGTYAVAAFQDTNGNGRLDRTGLGLPQEPYGFSGETGRRGRPEFAAAAFVLREPGALVRVRLSRALPRR